MCLTTNFFFVLKMKFTCTNLFIDQVNETLYKKQIKKNLQKSLYL